jgi:sugar phosphate isomerase/epimerase
MTEAPRRGHPLAPSRSASLQRRIAMNQLTTLRWSLADDLREYQAQGVPAIGLNWRKLTETGVRRAVRQIQQSRLPVSSVGWIGGFTGEYGHSLPEAMVEARKIIRTAGQLRASVVTVIAGPQGGHIRSHAQRLVADALQELAPLAALYEVTLALQPMHELYAKGWSFVNSLDGALEVLDRAGDPRVKLAFGAYHLWDEPDLLDRIGDLAPRTALVSLADWGEQAPSHENDRLLPGEGRLPLVDVIHAFEAGGYSGWYELEVWSRDLWKLDARDLMRRCGAARDSLTEQPALR